MDWTAKTAPSTESSTKFAACCRRVEPNTFAMLHVELSLSRSRSSGAVHEVVGDEVKDELEADFGPSAMAAQTSDSQDHPAHHGAGKDPHLASSPAATASPVCAVC